MSLEPSFYGNDVVRAELKYMEEIGNVQGPENNVVRAEMSLVPRSLEASSTVVLFISSGFRPIIVYPALLKVVAVFYITIYSYFILLFSFLILI